MLLYFYFFLGNICPFFSRKRCRFLCLQRRFLNRFKHGILRHRLRHLLQVLLGKRSAKAAFKRKRVRFRFKVFFLKNFLHRFFLKTVRHAQIRCVTGLYAYILLKYLRFHDFIKNCNLMNILPYFTRRFFCL